MKSRYLTHIVGVGDSIQSIGMRYGVDWTKLIIINGLEYPYIDSQINSTEYEDTDEVAKIGDRLVIPTQGLVIPSKTNNSGQELESYIFGSDLDLFTPTLMKNEVANLESLGELSDNDEGDVLLCRGIANLRQQIILRLGTPKGSLMMHPEWGCELTKYIGATLTMERLIQIKLCIQECVCGDFRVLGISDMRAVVKHASILESETARAKALFIDFIVHPIEPYSVFRVGHTFGS